MCAGVRMWGRGVVGGMLLAACLAGCAVVDPVDGRYDAIGRSLAKARNESIFLNIVRASHDYPLSFTTIGSVSPSMSNTNSFSLPSFLLGPSPRNVEPTFTPGRDIIFGNTTAATSLAISSNFNISTQETAQFYDGFLRPVDLTILDFFIRQGYSRELLFWMFADSFQVGPLGFQFNPPYDDGCPPQEPKRRCFREFVQIAVLLGLSVETRTVDTGGGKGDSDSGGGKDSGGGGKSKGSKGTLKEYARFCFDKVLQARAYAAMQQVDPARLQQLLGFEDENSNHTSPSCASPWTPDTSSGETDTLSFQVGRLAVSIRPRSAYSMFQFLGTLIKLQRDLQQPDQQTVVADVPRPDERELPLLATVADDRNLFTVTQNVGGICFVHTWFNDGDYCVPDDAANTKRIFSMLAQLIAIQTQATDLSITPNVRVVQ